MISGTHNFIWLSRKERRHRTCGVELHGFKPRPLADTFIRVVYLERIRSLSHFASINPPIMLMAPFICYTNKCNKMLTLFTDQIMVGTQNYSLNRRSANVSEIFPF